MSTKQRYDYAGRPLCTECGTRTHEGDCTERDITIERVRRVVAEGIAFRRDAATTARLVAKELGI